MPETLAVTICATEKYQYAMRAQARMVQANLRDYPGPIRLILCGDDGLRPVESLYVELFAGRPDFEIKSIRRFKSAAGENYKNAAQLLIAQMRTAAFAAARTAGASLCWSLDSDVIPKTALCFRTLHWLLNMPGAFYGVAISPYPSQGGGDFLTGRGNPERPIFSDFDRKERKVPEELLKKWEEIEGRLREAAKAGGLPPKELRDEADKLNREIDACPPEGNVFEMTAKHGFRRRGWLSQAYPALGRGAIVPSDWCGFGNTLLSRAALDEVDFLGYDGGGTEDLFAVFHRWHQAGIRIGSVLHEPSAHVCRRKDGKFFIAMPRFVTEADAGKGECVDHLRTLHRPFYAFEPNDVYDPANDGAPIMLPALEKAADQPK